MPIRIGLHSAAVPHLYTDWNASRQATTSLIKSVQLTAERLVRSPFTWVLRLVGDFRQRFTWRNKARQRECATLCAFDDRYEQLVDLICWGAQNTSVTFRESAYRDLRKWISDHYGSVRGKLQSGWSDPKCKSGRDPFESLLGF